MSKTSSSSRKEQRLAAVSDIRQKLHRANVAMSFLPASELSRHLGLGQKAVAEKLLGDQRLAQRLYWQLVDDACTPDIAAIPAHSSLKLIDSAAGFENACECVDISLALNERGIMISKDQIKELARRFGDQRLKWAWDNREIWVDAPSGHPNSVNKFLTGQMPKPEPDSTTKHGSTSRADARRMLLDHLAMSMPEIASWMGRKALSHQRKINMTPQMKIVERVVERLVNPTKVARHV